MDQEMNFPNPVVRTDLPTRRRRWPRVLLGCAGLGLVILVFLPQILSSKVGRKLVVSSIAAKTNSKVTLASFRTSWFGGTTIRYLNISDAAGRGIGAKSITTQASLWNLLRGRYKLGDCTIDGLHFEYVVDDGRGNDTFDLMRPPATPASPGVAAPVQSTASRLLPNLSGSITITDGTLVLHRGTVQPKLYNTTWEKGRLENVQAKIDIPQSLDHEWTYTFTADSLEGEQPRGSVTSSGTVDLGEGGQADVRRMKMDCTLTGEGVYTGGLGAALIPQSTPQDVREALGPVLSKVDVAIKVKDGRLTFPKFETSGPISNLRLRPEVDLTQIPPVLEIAENGSSPGVIQVGVSKRVANGVLVYLNPFFREAAGGQGGVTLHVQRLRLPLANRAIWAKGLEAKGRVWAQGVLLERNDEMKALDPLPDNLASQLALLTGDDKRGVTLDVDGPFSIAQGVVTDGPTATTVGETTLMIQGTTQFAGDAISATAALVRSPSITSLIQSGPSGITIPLTGTVRAPQLGIAQLKGNLSDQAAKAVAERVAQQTERMRAKEAQRQMQKSQRQVEEILRPLEPAPGASPGK
jgi:hypothetical protein